MQTTNTTKKRKLPSHTSTPGTPDPVSTTHTTTNTTTTHTTTTNPSTTTAPAARHTFSSTPWSYWNEWQEVYTLLFNTSPQTKKLGIKRVSAWRSRVSLPVAIESTAAIAEAIMLDSSPSNTSDTHVGLSVNSIKLLYSSAITRLVNGILDAKQIAHHPIPLTQLATENNFPQYLVDVRHQCSHSAELPSLQALRLAAEVGLHYLKTMYWERQTTALSLLRQSIFETLQKYKQLMHSLVKKGQLNTNSQNELLRVAEVKHCIEEITHIANPNLVQEVLVPLLLSCTNGEHFMLAPGTTLPKEFQMWHIALRKFSHVWSHFTGSLLLALVHQIVATSNSTVVADKECDEHQCNTVRTAWIGHVMRNYYPKHTNANSYAVPLISVANICLKNANQWTKQVLSHIYDFDKPNENSPDRSWEKLKEIADLKRAADALRERNKVSIQHLHKHARVSAESSGNAESSGRKFNITALEELLCSNTGELKPTTAEDSSVWKLSTQYPTSIPLGISPNGEFPSLSLPDDIDNFKKACFLSIAPVVPSAENRELASPVGVIDHDVLQSRVPECTPTVDNNPQNVGESESYDTTTAEYCMEELNSDSDIEIEGDQDPLLSIRSLFSMYQELF